jgi:hypothetical protein
LLECHKFTWEAENRVAEGLVFDSQRFAS